MDEFFNSIPLYATDLSVLLLKPANGDDGIQRQFEKESRVRRYRVEPWCRHLLANHPAYVDVTLNQDALDAMTDYGSYLSKLPSKTYNNAAEAAAARAPSRDAGL